MCLLTSVSFAFNPSEWHERAKNALIRVATHKQASPYLTAKEAQEWLREPWWGVNITCSEPTEQMWLQYCQNLYMENTAIDCNAVSATDKEFVMNNMRVCNVKETSGP